MKPLLKTSELESEPVVGRFYKVPCIRHFWMNYGSFGCRERKLWVPVLLPAHRDPDLLKAEPGPHYHFDVRFMSHRAADLFCFTWEHKDDLQSWRRLMTNIMWEFSEERAMGYRFKIKWKRRKCLRSMPPFPLNVRNNRNSQNPVKRSRVSQILESQFIGRRVCSNRLVCPHRGISLRGLPVQADGSIICPGHGLKICTERMQVVYREDEAIKEAL
jgi:hypothetical protein